MTRGDQAAHEIERPDLYEHQDVPPKGIIIFFVSLGAGILLVLVIVFWLYNWFAQRRAGVAPFPTIKLEQIPPEPRIQSDPRFDINAIHAQANAILSTYGWVDQKAGIVRIPIDRAMELLAQRGLPARTGAAAVPGVPDTGPESGGPQTGSPSPRFKPAQPAAGLESSQLSLGAPQSVPGPGLRGMGPNKPGQPTK